MTRQVAECEHGLPPGCPLHRSRARRALDVMVIVTLVVLDVAVFVLGIAWGYGLVRAAAAIMWGRP